VRRAWKWVAVVVAAVVVLAIALLAAVPYLVDTPRVQALIATSATQALGRPVKFSAVSLSALPRPSVVLENLEVAEDPAFGTAPFLRLNRAEVRLQLLPLLFRRVEFGDFVLKQPAITLIQRADGRWNIASLGPTGEAPEARAPGRPRSGSGASGAAAVLGSRVTIEQGVVAYESRADGSLSRYRVEDLDLTLTPSAGPLAFEGDARVKPGDLEVKISEGTVGLNGVPALTAAPVRGRLSLDGKDIKELMASALGPEPAIAGGLKGTLTLGGTVGKPRASGDVQLSNLTVTHTNPRCGEPKRRTLALGPIKLNTAWEEPRLTARPVTTTIANGTVTTNLTATLHDGVRVELGDLGIKALPVEKILVDFLCQGYAVTGPLDLTGRASARLPQLWTTLNGAGQIRLGPGKIVGAQALALLNNVVRLAGAVESVLSGEVPTWLTSALDYDSITGTYTITNGVVRTRDLALAGRALSGRVAGTYALASGVMNVDLTVLASRRELRAKVTGTAAQPAIAVAPGGLLTGSEKRKIEDELRRLLRKLR
jgi:uncharacterized protein involved in outer membrane biogenesis